jgi:signal transduction histidine kinase
MKINSSLTNHSFTASEFLCAICHELKTPLNAIVSFSEAIKEDINNPKLIKDCAEYAQEINHAANDLNDLVHDLLDVGQVTSGNFSVDLTKKIDVRDIIKRSVRINYDYSLKRNIVIETEISDDIKPINLDSKRMKQILANLISNAIKYSAPHSKVKISAKNINAVFSDYSVPAIEITICDHGFGMTESEIKTAFSKYKTIQNPNSNKVDSFGFGLPITKQLVENQKGIIEAKSKINEGTAIKLIFPYNSEVK